MADHLDEPSQKRVKMERFPQSTTDQDVLTPLDIFGLESNLPDELVSGGSNWGDQLGGNKPPAQEPGPGVLAGPPQLNGEVQSVPNVALRQMPHQQLHHLIQQQQQGNKNALVGNTLAMGQLGNKSPNLQSPSNLQGNMAGGMGVGMVNSMPMSISNNGTQTMNTMQVNVSTRTQTAAQQNLEAPGQQQPNQSVTMDEKKQIQQQQNPGAPGQQQPNQSVTIDKKKQIQQQLMLLLHAHKCTKRENKNPNNPMKCPVVHCKTMKDVLSHMANCKSNKDCQFPHCISSRQILLHWKNCAKQDCAICLPFRQTDKYRQPGGSQNGPIMGTVGVAVPRMVGQQHMVRAPNPHLMGSGPRMQNPNLPLGQINSMGGPNGPYGYGNPNQQGVNVNTTGGPQQPMLVNTISQQRVPPNIVMQGNRPGGPIGANIGLGNVGNDTGIITSQAQAPNQASTQSQPVAPTGVPTRPQTAAQQNPAGVQQQQNSGAPRQQQPNQSVTMDKKKQIQQRLMLLLHAHKCTKRENENPNNPMKCPVVHCKTMKDVLSHMANCKSNKDCQFPHCISSRQILLHWKNCAKQDCAICLPFRQTDKYRQPGASTTSAGGAPPNAQVDDADDDDVVLSLLVKIAYKMKWANS